MEREPTDHRAPSRGSSLRPAHDGLVGAAADLLLGGDCPGCHDPGWGLCRDCATEVSRSRPRPCHRPRVAGPIWAAGEYDGIVPTLINAAKERRRWDAIAPLSRLLAGAVAGLHDDSDRGNAFSGGPLVLVPAPSSPATVRKRGLDVTAAVADGAVGWLRRVGLPARRRSVLSHRRRVADQTGLDAHERRANLDHALVARSAPRGTIVIVDDVVTTGSTLAEAIRELEAAGSTVAGAAVVADHRLR